MSTTTPMEIGSILEFIENKTILITGATGFLAKVFLEKILRVQPNVKKLYLLLRAADSDSAIKRFINEIIAKDLFRVVKEKYGLNLNSMISEKIAIVPGDISCDGLGIQDLNLKDEMLNQIDVIINLAANTNLDDRYDVLIGINTMGAKHVLNFAKKCLNLQVLVHVSTAYVCGEGTGLITETPYQMGKALNEILGLNIEHKKELIKEKLKQLGDDGAAPKTIEQAMKDLGMERAKMYGWPNTYVFTKAMGEMIVEEMKGNLPLAVIRPSIVTSTYKEPFPGWTEGIRTIDGVAVGYGRGRLTCFLGDPNAISDIIPADMVVNVMMVAMVAHANNQSDSKIYHVGSSLRHPVTYGDFREIWFNYFKEKPWLDKQGKEIKVSKCKMITSMTKFHIYMAFRYLLPLKGLEFANTLFCKKFQSTYSDLQRKINLVMRLDEIYRPYAFFEGVFDDTNTENLRVAMKAGGGEADTFYFDPKCINWNTYFVEAHIPGLAKYVLK